MEEIISKSKFYKALVNNDIPMNKVIRIVCLLFRQWIILCSRKNMMIMTTCQEMGLEKRARPSDRTKTPEEIAQEEKERLEQLEEERQKRMIAAEDSSDEDNEDSEKPSKQKPRSLSGDDLGDSFSVNEETITKKGWIDEILERR
ncbi:Nucleolar protein 14 [Sesbania bispinosa]|nr:Nucleolar protein 14 [Sesbania bispinosa]